MTVRTRPTATANLGGVCQWIQSVNQTLKGQLVLEQHGGRTTHGVFTRVAQRLLAMAAGIWRNWTTVARHAGSGERARAVHE